MLSGVPDEVLEEDEPELGVWEEVQLTTKIKLAKNMVNQDNKPRIFIESPF